MAFKVSARGSAARKPFVYSKQFKDPGDVYNTAKLLEKILKKAKVPVGGQPKGLKKALSTFATMVITGLLPDVLSDFHNESREVWITVTHTGWTSYFRNKQYTFLNTRSLDADQEGFLKFVEVLKINRWGVLRAVVEVMSGYDTHIATYGRHSRSLLTIDIRL